MNSWVSDHPYQVSVAAGVLASLAFLTILPTIGILLALFFMFSVAGTAKNRTVFVLSWTLFQIVYAVLIVLPLARLNATWWGGLIDPKQEIIYTHLLAIGVAFLWALLLVPGLVLASRYWHSSRKRSLLLLVLVYGVTEYARMQVFHGYSWGMLGYGLVDIPFLRTLAYPFSVSALSLLLLLIAAGLAMLWQSHGTSQYVQTLRSFLNTFRRPGIIVLNSISIFVVSIVLSQQRSINETYRGMTFRTMSVTAPIEEQGFGLYRTYRKMIDAIPFSEKGFVLFPENALPFLIIDEETKLPKKPVFKKESEELFQDFLNLSRERAAMTFALPLHTFRERERFNSLLMIQDGEVRSIEHKQSLVPFFEFAPLGGNALAVEMTAGSEQQQGPFGLLVCSEIQQPLFLKRYDVVFAPANDGVFQSALVTRVHSNMARLRAIESGSLLLRATKSGVSEIILPDGTVATSQHGTASLLYTFK